jgi:drug/metabolite transporter (DMT)-like permease
VNRATALGLAWVTLVWGTGWLAIKLTLASFSPLFLAGSRYVVASALLWLLARALGAAAPRGRREWTALLGSGALMTGLCPGLVFWAQARIPSGFASLLFAAMPLFTALLAHRFLPGERLSWPRMAGIAVGLVGVAVVCAGGLGRIDLGDPAAVAAGSAAVLGGTVVFALGLVWMKRSGARFHPMIAVAVQSAAGAVVLLPVAALVEPEPIGDLGLFALAMFGYLTIVQSCLTQVIYVWLVKRVEATRISYISCVVPAIAVAAGALVLGEPIGWTLLVGGVGVVAGLYLVNRPSRAVTAG